MTGHHCNICIYSNGAMNTMHGGKQRRANGEGRIPAAGSEAAAGLPAAPWERRGEVVWEPRGPPSWAEGGEPLVARGELAFYLCPFSSVISAPLLQPQMANMAEGLAFVSKMMIMEVFFVFFFQPDRDVFFSQCDCHVNVAEYCCYFCIFLCCLPLTANVGLE